MRVLPLHSDEATHADRVCRHGPLLFLAELPNPSVPDLRRRRCRGGTQCNDDQGLVGHLRVPRQHGCGRFQRRGMGQVPGAGHATTGGRPAGAKSTAGSATRGMGHCRGGTVDLLVVRHSRIGPNSPGGVALASHGHDRRTLVLLSSLGRARSGSWGCVAPMRCVWPRRSRSPTVVPAER